jgi:hypothetical protein
VLVVASSARAFFIFHLVALIVVVCFTGGLLDCPLNPTLRSINHVDAKHKTNQNQCMFFQK